MAADVTVLSYGSLLYFFTFIHEYICIYTYTYTNSVFSVHIVSLRTVTINKEVKGQRGVCMCVFMCVCVSLSIYACVCHYEWVSVVVGATGVEVVQDTQEVSGEPREGGAGGRGRGWG